MNDFCRVAFHVRDRKEKKNRPKAVLLTDYLLAALFFHHDHVTGATNSEENVPEIRPNISGTEKLRSES